MGAPPFRIIPFWPLCMDVQWPCPRPPTFRPRSLAILSLDACKDQLQRYAVPALRYAAVKCTLISQARYLAQACVMHARLDRAVLSFNSSAAYTGDRES